MRKSLSFAILLTLCAAPHALAQVPAQPAAAAQPSATNGDTITQQFENFFEQEEKPKNLHEQGFELTIRMVERYTDTTEDYTISPDTPVIYRNSLLVRAESCVTDFNDIPGNDGGYITVEDRDGKMLFKGWIFKSFPSLTTFEHPEYDILVRGCEVK